MTNDESAPSDEGAVARVRERLAVAIERALDWVFDAPLDIRTPYEAMATLEPSSTGDGPGVLRKGAEWAASRAALRVGTRFGSKVAGRAALPLGVAVEFGFAARSGLRELQVLASFLVNRLRADGFAVDPELVRRATLALYLEPERRPDLRVPVHRRSLAIAKQWSVDAIPLTGRRQASRTRARVDIVARLNTHALVHDWRYVSAIEAPATYERPADRTLARPTVIDVDEVTPAGEAPPPPPRPTPPGGPTSSGSSGPPTPPPPPPPPR